MTKEQFQRVKVGDRIWCDVNFSKAHFGNGLYGYVKGYYTVVDNDSCGNTLSKIQEEHLGYIPCIDKDGRLSGIPYCFCELN